MSAQTPPGVLDGVALFDEFTPAEREALASRGRIVTVEPGTVLVQEGDEADALYVLLDGEVRVLRRDPAGNRVELARRRTGQCFGEMALIDGGLRSATIETATFCRLFALQRDVFLEVVAPAPHLLRKLLRDLSFKIRDSSERLVREDLEGRMRAAEAELARHRAVVQAVTGLAHELNTPLGVCVTTASHIEAMADSGDGALAEPAALLRDNLARAVALVEAFTAIAAGHHAGPPEDVDLAEVCEHAAALFAVERPAAGLTVAVRTGAARPWRGHRDHLECVLAELFANAAAHAYPPGAGGAVTVTVADGAIDHRPAWTIAVRDDGAGIAADALPKLFDAFYTTARGRGHKGLGLTVVYNTVTGPLAGRIQVDTTSGGGTTVTLTVPRAV
ncbi:MAG TPA: cyclic nucleotide-binding domain-containing protein [Azospirillum sp.]|nr:cyclic nucleotide-binding domain-containing protein [Azospirillum sp.]